MAAPDHLLTVVSAREGEVFIHADLAGLDVLIHTLQRVRTRVQAGRCEHDHLMTDAWGGSELSERATLQDGSVVHHLKLFGWTDEWARRHGFRDSPPNQSPEPTSGAAS